MSEAIGANIEQARQHRANSMKLNVLMALASIMTVIVTICGVIVAAKFH